MYFKKHNTETLDKQLFKNPTAEYRAIPFWAWNCELDKDVIARQIEAFDQMGFGGFQMHGRAGLKTEYLGEKFMDCISFGAEEAEKRNMLAWLYDEDRWPSGSAGGKVTKDVTLRERKLYFTPYFRHETYCSKEEAIATGTPYFVAAYDIELNEQGELVSYRVIGKDEPAVHEKWCAEAACDGGAGWYNGQTYLDLFNPAAVRRFIDITYGEYKNSVGEKLGKQIPAAFFDEPAFSNCQPRFGNPLDKKELTTPWGEIEDRFVKKYGFSIVESLPELFWQLPNGEQSRARYCYYDFKAAEFAANFTDQIAKWCRENNLTCTGHYLLEGNLEQCAARSGDVMRQYFYEDIPAIDTLSAATQFTTVLQARSIDNQRGGQGILCELYGATNWDFDFRGHKTNGDWQSALGVTLRVPHLSYMSLEGEAKRDFPASIFSQSSWYKEYPMIENHFSRVHTALTRGKMQVKVAMVHPIETVWMNMGPQSKTSAKIQQTSALFSNITNNLLTHHIGLDYLCEALLPEQCEVGGAPLQVGAMAYETVIVPNVQTLRRTTVERLTAFQKAGGQLIFIGDCPTCVDGVLSDDVRALYAASTVMKDYAPAGLLSLLADRRDVIVRNAGAGENDRFVSQLRQDKQNKWLFVAHCRRDDYTDIAQTKALEIRVKGKYAVEEYNTTTGDVLPRTASFDGEYTVIPVTVYEHDSLLFCLTDAKEPVTVEQPVNEYTKQVVTNLIRPVPYTLSEPNVLLLDCPAYAFDEEAWQPEDEVCRITRAFKKWIGYPVDSTQPWALPAETDTPHVLHLRYTLHSTIEFEGARLALENPQDATITFNGEPLNTTPVGYYMDETIKTVLLPTIHKGDNLIEVSMPFRRRTFAEAMYVLGEFGVRLAGAQPQIIPMPETLGFSDITAQGFPFYGGMVTFHATVDTPADATLTVAANRYAGAMLRVTVDGEQEGNLTFAPYRFTTTALEEGTHAVDIVFANTRYNTLAAIHAADTRGWLADPNSFRKVGDAWTYNYMVKPSGILVAPTVTVATKGE